MATEIDQDQQLSAFGPARSTIAGAPLDAETLRRIDSYWRATLYLSLGMIYLKDNPLLRTPLQDEHVKKRLLGHWGSDPGMSLTYIHLNRLIKKYDLDMIFLAGPGHGAPALLSNAYSRGDLLRDVPPQEPRPSRNAAFFQGVLVPRRHRQPLHSGNSRFDSRGRRARLFGFACLRRRVRQSGPDRGRDGRRWRSRNRSLGHGLALEQILESRARWGRAADLASKRLQDQQPHDLGPHHARRARGAVSRLRLHALLRRGLGRALDAPGARRHARTLRE